MDTKIQIVGWVRRIDELEAETEKHWVNVRKSIADGRVDDAISLLNAYFALKEELTGLEAKLASLLHGNYSDK